jgi:PqqD family protein of HPr-rel-A system
MTDANPRKVGEVWTRQEGDQTAVFDPSSGRLTRLNPSALAIWELCDGETSQDEIIDAVAELTGRSREEVATEVNATIRQLFELGLIY